MFEPIYLQPTRDKLTSLTNLYLISVSDYPVIVIIITSWIAQEEKSRLEYLSKYIS